MASTLLRGELAIAAFVRLNAEHRAEFSLRVGVRPHPHDRAWLMTHAVDIADAFLAEIEAREQEKPE